MGFVGTVERTLAWLTAYRRLARDYEGAPATSEAMIRWTAINTMTSPSPKANPPHSNNAGTGPTSRDRVSTAR